MFWVLAFFIIGTTILADILEYYEANMSTTMQYIIKHKLKNVAQNGSSGYVLYDAPYVIKVSGDNYYTSFQVQRKDNGCLLYIRKNEWEGKWFCRGKEAQQLRKYFMQLKNCVNAHSRQQASC